MSIVLNERLNRILPRVISDDFLNASGIGNEIALYIFDYPPKTNFGFGISYARCSITFPSKGTDFGSNTSTCSTSCWTTSRDEGSWKRRFRSNAKKGTRR